MAKKKKKRIVSLTPEQQQEADYQKAVRRMEGADKMLQSEDRLRMCRQAVKMFDAMGDYKDSRANKERCQKRLPHFRREYRKETYHTGKKLKDEAKSALDYDAAIAEFEKIKREYKDVPKHIEECRLLKQKAIRNEKRRAAGKKILMFAVLVTVVGFVLYLRTPAACYLEARVLMSVKDYERASTMFSYSMDYKDTQELRQECDYQRAISFGQKGAYERALSILNGKVGDYKDAAEKKAYYELRILAAAQPGDTVWYGTDKWLVAERAEHSLLLVHKKMVSDGFAYQASGKAADWEASDIRKWLNQQFYKEYFSVYEQSAILETDVVVAQNSVYGTDGGAATQDKVFLLDEKEAEQYRDLLTISGNQQEWWLRTPGKTQESAAFVSPQGDVMHYGYAVDSDEIAVRPAIWVSVQ